MRESKYEVYQRIIFIQASQLTQGNVFGYAVIWIFDLPEGIISYELKGYKKCKSENQRVIALFVGKFIIAKRILLRTDMQGSDEILIVL